MKTLRLPVRALAAGALALGLLAPLAAPVAQAQTQKRLMLQGFWWDFKNDNYPQGWANYLADLAPRLKAAGVQAVWVPVSVKNANPFSVGYSPFDHYDLGDKYQKGNLKTPFGDKDELLRMVAVMHANGIEVVQDIVYNHMDGAGSNTGAGSVDPGYTDFITHTSGVGNDPSGGNKTFRYSCYASPAGDESAADYLARKGRWPKNWENFYPNRTNLNTTGDDPSGINFGPDIAYNDPSFGQAIGAGFDPLQHTRYMRDSMRVWSVWMKKQTGIDGVRMDAVKHFPAAASEDFLYNLENNAGWATGTDNMLAVGEWAGSTGEIDQWTRDVQGRAGTFDFGLRGYANQPGLYGMVYGNGAYDLRTLPGLQQSERARTFPWVNSHDSFRPPLLANGNYPAGSWSGEQPPNIDPRQPRAAAAYAVALAVDGNPTVFFEDLLNVGTTGMRYTHVPSSATDLPLHADIANLTACHTVLGFKQGAYFVPYQTEDYLVIERGGKAVIGVTDNWDTWQSSQNVATHFAPGTRLIDYGGSSPATDVRVVRADGTAYISTPPCNGTALRRGYSVWAPEGQNISAPVAAARQTTQEWEMADDLGDSHPRSLGQGGALPAASLALRYAGKIYPAAGQAVTANMYLTDAGRDVVLYVLDKCGRKLDSSAGVGTRTLVYTPTAEGWIQFAARQSSVANPSQRAYIKVSYLAPATIDARANPSFLPTLADLGPDRALCRMGGQLTAASGPGFTYRWTDSAGAQVGTGAAYSPSHAGVFAVIKTNTASGCTAISRVRVTALVDAPTAPTLHQSGDTLFIDNPQPGLSYQWLRSSTALPGATNAYYVAGAQAGFYAVRVTNATGCFSLTNFFPFTTSVTSQIAAGIGLAPNPTGGRMRVELTGLAAQAVRLALLLPDGRRLALPASTRELNMSAYPAGVYVLEVATPAGVGRKRVVRE